MFVKIQSLSNICNSGKFFLSLQVFFTLFKLIYFDMQNVIMDCVLMRDVCVWRERLLCYVISLLCDQEHLGYAWFYLVLSMLDITDLFYLFVQFSISQYFPMTVIPVSGYYFANVTGNILQYYLNKAIGVCWFCILCVWTFLSHYVYHL